MRDKIWDDGLHLTKDGYKLMGDAIASRMIELLQSCTDPRNTGKKILDENGAKKPANEDLSAPIPSDSL